MMASHPSSQPGSAEKHPFFKLLVLHQRLAGTPLRDCENGFQPFDKDEEYFSWVMGLESSHRRAYERALREENERIYGEDGLLHLLTLHSTLTRAPAYEDRYPPFVNMQEYQDWLVSLHGDELRMYKWQLEQDYREVSALRAKYWDILKGSG